MTGIIMRWSARLVLVGSYFLSLAYAQQPLLQITSPYNQSSAPEGQALTITVSADPSVQDVYVTTQYPLPNVQPTSSTTQFTLSLPNTVTPGLYQITASGVTPSGDVESVPGQIDVERKDAPVSISAKPTFVTISKIGATQPSNVQGTFADGS